MYNMWEKGSSFYYSYKSTKLGVNGHIYEFMCMLDATIPKNGTCDIFLIVHKHTMTQLIYFLRPLTASWTLFDHQHLLTHNPKTSGQWNYVTHGRVL